VATANFSFFEPMKRSRCENCRLSISFAWFYLNHFRWDSDEFATPSRRLGMGVWSPAYTDVFDNHSPLFHWLCSPIFVWLGERPDIIAAMRWLMVPHGQKLF